MEKSPEQDPGVIGRTGKFLKRSFIAAIGVSLLSPLAVNMYEWKYSSDLKDRFDKAASRISEEKLYTCSPDRAGSSKNNRQKQISNLFVQTYEDYFPPVMEKEGLSVVSYYFYGGLKRISNNVVPKIFYDLDVNGQLPDEYKKGKYSIPLENIVPYLESLNQLGIGVCFDQELNKEDLGSAYYPRHGLITLNPDLSDKDMSEHLRKHLHQLKGDVVLPYKHLAQKTTNRFNSYEERFLTLKQMVDDIVDGDIVGLPKQINNKATSFVKTKKQKAPILK